MIRREFLKLAVCLPFISSLSHFNGNTKKDEPIAVLLCLMQIDKTLISHCQFDIREMEEKGYIRQMLQSHLYSARVENYQPTKIICNNLGDKEGFVWTEIVLFCKQGEPMKAKDSIDWVHRNGKITQFNYEIKPETACILKMS
jgi:hypothetical protein